MMPMRRIQPVQRLERNLRLQSGWLDCVDLLCLPKELKHRKTSAMR